MKVFLLAFNAMLLVALTCWGWQGWVRATEADYKVDRARMKIEALSKKVNTLESNIKLREKIIFRLEQESAANKASTEYLYTQVSAYNAKIEGFQVDILTLKTELEAAKKKPIPPKKVRRVR